MTVYMLIERNKGTEINATNQPITSTLFLPKSSESFPAMKLNAPFTNPKDTKGNNRLNIIEMFICFSNTGIIILRVPRYNPVKKTNIVNKINCLFIISTKI